MNPLAISPDWSSRLSPGSAGLIAIVHLTLHQKPPVASSRFHAAELKLPFPGVSNRLGQAAVLVT